MYPGGHGRGTVILKEGGRDVRNWSLSTLLVVALTAAACSRSDRRDAKSQIHDAQQQVKQDLRDAQREIHKDLKQANRDAEHALSEARREIRETIHDQKERGRKKDDPDK
jgi:F0F1-type ATP synthase membrane subunit b/b'